MYGIQVIFGALIAHITPELFQSSNNGYKCNDREATNSVMDRSTRVNCFSMGAGDGFDESRSHKINQSWFFVNRELKQQLLLQPIKHGDGRVEMQFQFGPEGRYAPLVHIHERQFYDDDRTIVLASLNNAIPAFVTGACYRNEVMVGWQQERELRLFLLRLVPRHKDPAKAQAKEDDGTAEETEEEYEATDDNHAKILVEVEVAGSVSLTTDTSNGLFALNVNEETGEWRLALVRDGALQLVNPRVYFDDRQPDLPNTVLGRPQIDGRNRGSVIIRFKYSSNDVPHRHIEFNIQATSLEALVVEETRSLAI
jgi:hypothetical protein